MGDVDSSGWAINKYVIPLFQGKIDRFLSTHPDEVVVELDASLPDVEAILVVEEVCS